MKQLLRIFHKDVHHLWQLLYNLVITFFVLQIAFIKAPVFFLSTTTIFIYEKHLRTRTYNQQFSKGAMVELIIGRRMTTTYYKINYIGNYGAVISMHDVIHLLTDHRDGITERKLQR